MKWSTRILLFLLVVVIAGMLASNIILRNEYKSVDKNDRYWNYGKILDQPFKYLKIDGGNSTQIAFEQSPNCSVRVWHTWQRVRPNPIKAFVNNDTLYIQFTYQASDPGEQNWMKWNTLVRIFSPVLLSVVGNNTNFEMFKLKQANISVNMTGKSKFEVESFVPDLDSINVTQKDSSEVVFEMSPEYTKANIGNTKSKKVIQVAPSVSNELASNEAMTIQSLRANLQGNTILDVGHAQIRSLILNVTDSSAIVLSGCGLRRFCQQ
jgi:hypothetical protein